MTRTSIRLPFICLLAFVAGIVFADDVVVDWADWDDDHLYDSAGVDMRTGSNLFQLVMDMNGDTEVGAMISNNYYAIGGEAGDTGDYGADDDETVDLQNAQWSYLQEHDYGSVSKIGLYDENDYASTRFYFRFFNAANTNDATEAGLIYHTTNAWITASSALAFEQAIADLARVGAAAVDLFGSTDGVHANGWATMPGAVNPDADGDGIIDAWEIHYLGGTNAAPGGHGDSDTMTNLEEFHAGTDPTNAASEFTIYIVGSGDLPVVQFTALEADGPGYDDLERYYDLISASNVMVLDWLPVPGQTNILGEGQLVSYTNTSHDTLIFRANVHLE
jgi:hypothetical protein